MSILRIKNWSDFQHYKDRSPPWIKLHKSLLDNYEYQCLPIASRALAPMLWLLASESNSGEFDGASNKLAFRLRVSEKEILDGLNPLIQAGFVISDSDLLADCKHDAIPEREKRRVNNTSVSHEKIVFDGSRFQNINGQLEIWKTAYPAINVESELNKAAAWIVANPKNTKKQWGRFINGWLSRAQDRAPRVVSNGGGLVL